MNSEQQSQPQKPALKLFIGYMLISVISTVVDTAVLIALKEKLRCPVWLSASGGYGCGMATNFLLNKYVNFGSASRSIMRQARTFFIVAIIGLGLKAFLMEVFVNLMEVRLLPSIALAIAIVWFWNFWGHRTLTFQEGIRSFVFQRLKKINPKWFGS